MWRFLGTLLLLLVAAAVGYFWHAVQTENFGVKLFSGTTFSATYPDLIAIILTAFGVILATASIGLGTAAIVGWNSIEGKAMRIAARVIQDDLEDTQGKLHETIKNAIANPDSPLHLTLKKETQKIMYSGVVTLDNNTDTVSDAS